MHAAREVHFFIEATTDDRADRSNCMSTLPEILPFHRTIGETLLYPNSSAARFAFPPSELKTTLSVQADTNCVEHRRDMFTGSD
jgi:hypothetical protein